MHFNGVRVDLNFEVVVFISLASWLCILKHFRWEQGFFFLPGPPNFVISKQNLQEPQSGEVHPAHSPHLFRFTPTNTMSVINLDKCINMLSN